MSLFIPCTKLFHQISRQELGPQFSSIIIGFGKFVIPVGQGSFCPHKFTFLSLLGLLIWLVIWEHWTSICHFILGLLLLIIGHNLRLTVYLSLVVPIVVNFSQFLLQAYTCLLVLIHIFAYLTVWLLYLSCWVHLALILFH